MKTVTCGGKSVFQNLFYLVCLTKDTSGEMTHPTAFFLCFARSISVTVLCETNPVHILVDFWLDSCAVISIVPDLRSHVQIYCKQASRSGGSRTDWSHNPEDFNYISLIVIVILFMAWFFTFLLSDSGEKTKASACIILCDAENIWSWSQNHYVYFY